MSESATLVPWVNGRTRLFGIIGHPIEQVRSPERITTVFQRAGFNAILLPMQVLPDRFEPTLAGLMALGNLDGFVVTVPYKAQAMALADELGAQARRVGAINALVRAADGRWRGEMFDGLGCVAGLEKNGVVLAGSRVQLLGAGGAGRAIAVAVCDRQPALLRLHDPDHERAAALAAVLRATVAETGQATRIEIAPFEPGAVDLLLNASAVGMLDDARLPIAAGPLPSSLTVFDAIVVPEETPLLAHARQCGCRAISGLAMLDGQVAQLAAFLRG